MGTRSETERQKDKVREDRGGERRGALRWLCTVGGAGVCACRLCKHTSLISAETASLILHLILLYL